jgi:hypothetical protein
MSSNILAHEAMIDAWLESGVKQELSVVHRALVLGLVSDLIFETPVAEGRARGGWDVARDEPPESESGRVDPDGSATLAAAGREVALIDAPAKTWVVNNVPYIRRLNDGWSQQAPAGFVDAIMSKYQTAIGG